MTDCRKGCKKVVKGPGLYALGHAPGSHVGRTPSVLQRLRERFEGQAVGVALFVFIALLLVGCQTYDATRQAASPVINATTEKIQPYAQEADQRVAGAIKALTNDTNRSGP